MTACLECGDLVKDCIEQVVCKSGITCNLHVWLRSNQKEPVQGSWAAGLIGPQDPNKHVRGVEVMSCRLLQPMRSLAASCRWEMPEGPEMLSPDLEKMKVWMTFSRLDRIGFSLEFVWLMENIWIDGL